MLLVFLFGCCPAGDVRCNHDDSGYFIEICENRRYTVDEICQYGCQDTSCCTEESPCLDYEICFNNVDDDGDGDVDYADDDCKEECSSEGKAPIPLKIGSGEGTPNIDGIAPNLEEWCCCDSSDMCCFLEGLCLSESQQTGDIVCSKGALCDKNSVYADGECVYTGKEAVARAGYYVPGEEERIELYDSIGRTFIYVPSYHKWEERDMASGEYFDDSQNTWCNQDGCGVLPDSFKPVTGYFIDSASIKESHLFGTHGQETKLMIYDLERWYDKTSDIFSGTYFDSSKSQWCNDQECGVLPANLVVKTGYFFPSSSGGRANLFGQLDADQKIFVFNPNSQEWYDRTSSILSGDEGMLPADFEAGVGFYYPLTKDSSEVMVFGESGNVIEVYSLTTDDNLWNQITGEISTSGLPLDMLPVAAYYDPFIGANVIWYRDEIYTGFILSYEKDDDYMYYLGIPPDEGYIGCRPDSFTPEQIAHMDDLFSSASQEEISDWIRQDYPWIDIDNIDYCDKFFLVNEFIDMMSALNALQPD